MTGTNEKFVVVFEQERPLRCVKFGLCVLRFYRKVTLQLGGCDLIASKCRSHRESSNGGRRQH